MQVQGIGAFVRALLPIRLTGGYSLTVGTWIAIDPSLMRAVWEDWDTERYATLALDGFLANAIPPWGRDVLGAPAKIAVLDPAMNPRVVSSEAPLLHALISEEWGHDEVLGAYASLR